MSKIEVFDIKKNKNVTLKKPMAEAMFKMGFVDFLNDDGSRIPNPKSKSRQTYSTRMLTAEGIQQAGENKNIQPPAPVKKTVRESLGLKSPSAKEQPEKKESPAKKSDGKPKSTGE